jgi:glyoxylase-like metal-dependent hydrolase (beta-lactamase superfamily II)
MQASQVGDGVVRITFPLPFGIEHVHCYAIESGDGWLIVDTGLGVDDAEQRWIAALEELGGPVKRIFVTHFHPDHVGAAAVLARLTGAPVLQGREDYRQCVSAWGRADAREVLVAYMVEHGLPDDDAAQMRSEATTLSRFVHFACDPEPVDDGDEVDGWSVVHLPGHADGHLCLLRGEVLIAGDALLATISPNVGLYPDARPDPLGDYFASLERLVELSPRVAFGGHGPTIEEPGERARELIAHHRERLDVTLDAVDGTPRSAYEVSLHLFPDELDAVQRRFALAETLAHLEYLAHRGATNRDGTRYVR